jgi:hypothetical protein
MSLNIDGNVDTQRMEFIHNQMTLKLKVHEQ